MSRLTLVFRLVAVVVVHLTAFAASAVPVTLALVNPNTAYMRMTMTASDSFDTVQLFTEDVAPVGGEVTGERLGIVDPGFNLYRFSLHWDALTFDGVVPFVGDFSIVLDPIKINLDGDPLNYEGRLKPANGYDFWRATSASGGPTGTLTVAGNSSPFDLGSFDCSPEFCADGVVRTTDLTDLNVQDFFDPAQWSEVPLMSAAGVDYRLTVEVLWVADYTVVPEPSTALLLAFGLAGLALGCRRKTL